MPAEAKHPVYGHLHVGKPNLGSEVPDVVEKLLAEQDAAREAARGSGQPISYLSACTCLDPGGRTVYLTRGATGAPNFQHLPGQACKPHPKRDQWPRRKEYGQSAGLHDQLTGAVADIIDRDSKEVVDPTQPLPVPDDVVPSWKEGGDTRSQRAEGEQPGSKDRVRQAINDSTHVKTVRRGSHVAAFLRDNGVEWPGMNQDDLQGRRDMRTLTDLIDTGLDYRPDAGVADLFGMLMRHVVKALPHRRDIGPLEVMAVARIHLTVTHGWTSERAYGVELLGETMPGA